MSSTKIKDIRARQIFDSRGRPTVEVDVILDDDSIGRASVPSGASTGTFEACELRDGGTDFDGLGVRNAVSNVENEVCGSLLGKDAANQREIDEYLTVLDGTPDLSRLGANAILGVSLAACRATANLQKIPLYRRIAEISETRQISLPVPMVNILSGGLHAGRGMDVQDFLFIPAKSVSVEDAIGQISRVRDAANKAAAEIGITTLLADEGGLSPECSTSREALDLMMRIFDLAEMNPSEDALIAIDVAASSLRSDDGSYSFPKEERHYSSSEVIDMVVSWTEDYPVVSVEDALGESDWENWTELNAKLGDKIQIVGDDLFTTNPKRLERGIKNRTANAVLIKLNQNGTLTGTLDVIRKCKQFGLATVVSARSGETNDDFIADLAVGTDAGQIKIGSFRNSERLSKYNQLLRIEQLTRAPHRASKLPWN